MIRNKITECIKYNETKAYITCGKLAANAVVTESTKCSLRSLGPI